MDMIWLGTHYSGTTRQVMPDRDLAEPCAFTGPFIDPIKVWDEPRLLKFSVTSNPAPMREWTPYEAIHPPHLEGFLVSSGG